MENKDTQATGTAGQQRRYSRLARYSGLAPLLERWQASCCAVLGLGGLGGAIAPQLARLGVRRLVLIDRDTVSWENLGHQQLFDEAQAAAGLPKAVAAQQALARINSAVEIDARVGELNRPNISELLAGCELLFDGLDNYFTRLLLNDYAWATGTPYFYAGVVRGELSALALIPGRSGCLRCLVDRPPPPGSLPSCASEGVFPPLLNLAALLQLELAGRWLSGAELPDILYSFDMQSLRMRQTTLTPRADCPVCSAPPGQGRYDYLDGLFDSQAASACASGRVELTLAHPLDLDLVQRQLEASGDFALRSNPWCLSAERDGESYTVFPGGRLVLEGSDDPARLNHFAATYLGL